MGLQKDQDTRKTEIMNIIKQLNDIELSHGIQFNIKNFVELKDFFQICQTYIHDGKTVNGKIKISSINRELHYDFPRSANKECNVVLKIV